jgi:hypothetical protein
LYKWFKEGIDNVEYIEKSSCSKRHRCNERVEKRTESCFMRYTKAVSKAYFIEILVRLCKGVFRIRHELWLISWCLRYDSTPFQWVLSIKQFMAKKQRSWTGTAPLFPSFGSQLCASLHHGGTKTAGQSRHS